METKKGGVGWKKYNAKEVLSPSFYWMIYDCVHENIIIVESIDYHYAKVVKTFNKRTKEYSTNIIYPEIEEDE